VNGSLRAAACLLASAAAIAGCTASTPRTPAPTPPPTMVAPTATPSVIPTATQAALATASGAPSPRTSPIATPTASPGDGDILATVETGFGPCAIAELGGSVWVTNLNEGTLSRIDGASNEVTDEVDVGSQPCGIASDGTALWLGVLGEHALVRFDPESNTVTDRFDVGGPVWDVQFGHGAIWVAVQQADQLLRIDPDQAHIVETLDVGAQPSGLAITETEVWVATSVGAIMRVDPATNERLPDLVAEGDPTWFASAPGSVVVTFSNGGTVSIFNSATTELIMSFPLGPHARDPGFVGGNFWVTVQEGNEVQVVSPSSGDILGSFNLPEAIAIWSAEGLLGDGWVLDFGGNEVFRMSVDSGLGVD
jgi:YVTN family beta-propeller protein